LTKVSDITSYLLSKYPLNLASSFDMGKIGLQFGSHNKEVKKVIITLDTTNEVIDYAIKENVDLIISHHPFMFNSVISFNYDNPLQDKIRKVIKNDLNLFAMHTNFDVAKGGMNECLSAVLGLTNIHMVGSEVTSDSFLRMGEIAPTFFKDFINIVKEKFNLNMVRYVGDEEKIIKKIGIVGGAGSNDAYEAFHHGCDCFITGEVKHNVALDVIDLDKTLIEVPHAVEAVFKEFVKKDLEARFTEVSFITLSTADNPFKVK